MQVEIDGIGVLENPSRHPDPEGTNVLYELRTYHVVPGRMPALHDRFRNTTLGFFAKHGIRVVGFWTSEIGRGNDELVYLLAWESLAEREQRWGAFQADPAWIAARAATERDGPLVARVTNAILRPTPYSPLP